MCARPWNGSNACGGVPIRLCRWYTQPLSEKTSLNSGVHQPPLSLGLVSGNTPIPPPSRSLPLVQAPCLDRLSLRAEVSTRVQSSQEARKLTFLRQRLYSGFVQFQHVGGAGCAAVSASLEHLATDISLFVVRKSSCVPSSYPWWRTTSTGTSAAARRSLVSRSLTFCAALGT